MSKKLGLGILIVVLAAIAGVVRSVGSWNGIIFVSNSKYLQGERFPAAIRNVFDYSEFEGAPLKIRSLKRLISGARVVANSDKVGVELGHFVTRNSDGKGQLACEYYDRILLKFEGEGVMESGEVPQMTIEAPCTISSDINRIETIWIPSLRLIQENQAPARYLEVSYPDQKDVHFKFEEMTSVWPKEWILTGIRLYSELNSGREISISRSEIAETLHKNLTIRF